MMIMIMVSDKRIDNYVAPDSLLLYMYGLKWAIFFIQGAHSACFDTGNGVMC